MTSALMDFDDVSVPATAALAKAKTRRVPRPVAVFLRLPRVWTWTGLVVIAAGLVLITIAWGDTAATEVVGDQLPYIMSAGLIGLACVCIGATIVAIDAKLTDSTARRAQALELRDALADLRAVDETALLRTGDGAAL